MDKMMGVKVNLQLGDIFLTDSNKIGAKMVKFFMTAKTVWHWIWRKVLGTNVYPRYYHAGMILDNDELIEQQSKVQYGNTSKILNPTWKVIVYRKKSLTDIQRKLLELRAIRSVGKGYGVIDILGKTLTWLTGITWFQKFFGWITKNEAICVNRVGEWYKDIDSFGSKTPYDITTKTMDLYCSDSLDWEVVYQNEVNE